MHKGKKQRIIQVIGLLLAALMALTVVVGPLVSLL